jgi:hypothetical protein
VKNKFLREKQGSHMSEQGWVVRVDRKYTAKQIFSTQRDAHDYICQQRMSFPELSYEIISAAADTLTGQPSTLAAVLRIKTREALKRKREENLVGPEVATFFQQMKPLADATAYDGKTQFTFKWYGKRDDEYIDAINERARKEELSFTWVDLGPLNRKEYASCVISWPMSE